MTTGNNEPTNSSIQAVWSRSRRNKIIRNIVVGMIGLTICGAIIVIFGLVWLGNTLREMDGFLNYPQCPVSNPSGVEEVAQFKLPPSAKLLSTYCGGMQGLGAGATFQMSPSDLNIFLTTTHVKLPLSNANRPKKLRCSCDETLKITDYLYGEYRSFKWDEEVFIDTHDKDLYTVYFTVLGG